MAFAHGEGEAHAHGHSWFDGWSGMMFHPLVMIFLVATIAVLAILALRWLVGSRQAAAPPEATPLEILEARFARGEIDREEFEERRRVLDG